MRRTWMLLALGLATLVLASCQADQLVGPGEEGVVGDVLTREEEQPRVVPVVPPAAVEEEDEGIIAE